MERVSWVEVCRSPFSIGEHSELRRDELVEQSRSIEWNDEMKYA